MKPLGFNELLEYLNRYNLAVRVTRGVSRLVKPDTLTSDEFQKHAEYLLPHLKANRSAFAGEYDQTDSTINGVISFRDMHPSRKREVIYERFALRAASCAGRLGWFSWYTRLTGYLASGDELPQDANRACVIGADGRTVEDWRDVPGHTFPAKWKGLKADTWHVPPRIALALPDGCMLPPGYATPEFVKAAERKARFAHYREGWKPVYEYKDSLPPD